MTMRFEQILAEGIAQCSYLLGDTGRLKQEHERPGRAIHDRHFCSAEFDKTVVDAETSHGGEQMLYRRHTDTVFYQRRGQHGLTHILRTGTDFDHRVEVRAAEDDPRVDGCWLQGQVYLFPGMQANTGRADGVFECPLSDHRFIIPSQKVDILNKKLPGEYQNSRLSTI